MLKLKFIWRKLIFNVFLMNKANFDHFNELKTLILSIIHRILHVHQVKKQGVRQFERMPQFE